MDAATLDDRLARYAEAVRACPHNLLSPRGLRELETRHIPEAVAFARRLPADVELVDIGPGGGLPGMVIALCRPDIAVTMVEATRKKADFLRATAVTLGCDVEVHHGRIEELGRSVLAGRFDVATARAVASLDRLVPWTLPALRPGGQLWAIKGERWEQELEEARPTLARMRAQVVATPRPVDGGADPGPAVVIIAAPEGRAADRGES